MRPPARAKAEKIRTTEETVADDDGSYRVRPPFKTQFDDRLDHSANSGCGQGSAISQSERADKLTWSLYIKLTPTKIAAKASS